MEVLCALREDSFIHNLFTLYKQRMFYGKASMFYIIQCNTLGFSLPTTLHYGDFK